MKKMLVLAALAVMSLGSLAAFETTKTLTLPADGLRGLEIRAGAGSLTVTGRDGLKAIEVRAEIVVRHVGDKEMDRYLSDRVELTLEKRGDQAVLVSRMKERFRLFSFGDDGVINLTVLVPKELPLDADDGSGGVVIEDVAGVRIDDGSGSLRIDRVAGEVRVVDGSGDIEINDVAGDVTVDDGSGGILIRRIGGTVTVDDGSGSIDIDGVEKDVRILSAGSGSVDVSNVKGKLIRSK